MFYGVPLCSLCFIVPLFPAIMSPFLLKSTMFMHRLFLCVTSGGHLKIQLSPVVVVSRIEMILYEV